MLGRDKADVVDARDEVIAGLTGQLVKLREAEQALRKTMDDAFASMLTAKRKAATSEEENTELHTIIERLSAEVAQKDNEVTGLQEKLKETQEQLAQMSHNLISAQDDIAKLKRKHNQIESEALVKANAQIKSLQAQVEALFGQVRELTAVKSKAAKDFETRLADEQNEFDDRKRKLEDEKTALATTLFTKTEEVKRLENRIAALERSLEIKQTEKLQAQADKQTEKEKGDVSVALTAVDSVMDVVKGIHKHKAAVANRAPEQQELSIDIDVYHQLLAQLALFIRDTIQARSNNEVSLRQDQVALLQHAQDFVNAVREEMSKPLTNEEYQHLAASIVTVTSTLRRSFSNENPQGMFVHIDAINAAADKHSNTLRNTLLCIGGVLLVGLAVTLVAASIAIGISSMGMGAGVSLMGLTISAKILSVGLAGLTGTAAVASTIGAVGLFKHMKRNEINHYSTAIADHLESKMKQHGYAR